MWVNFRNFSVERLDKISEVNIFRNIFYKQFKVKILVKNQFFLEAAISSKKFISLIPSIIYKIINLFNESRLVFLF